MAGFDFESEMKDRLQSDKEENDTSLDSVEMVDGEIIINVATSKKSRRKSTQIYFDDALLKKIDKECRRLGKSRTEFVSMMMEFVIDKLKK